MQKADKNFRAHWHDYSLPGLYMVTVTTLNRHPFFGQLALDPDIHIALTPLGRHIMDKEIGKMSEVYPNVDVWKVCMMPDHIHIIIHIREPFADNATLGSVVRGFKAGCNKAYRKIYGVEKGTIFELKYNDRILLKDMHRERWFNYLDDNPRRLAVKRAHPDLFTVINNMEIQGLQCQITGNRFLLDVPDKMAIVVHNSDTPREFERKRDEWLSCGERGGVLVSAAIAPREKQVMREAMDRGYSLILLRNIGFPPIYKPSGEAFDACASGRLLQISPWPYEAARRKISRRECLFLNSLALRITGEGM